jgi:hypothetical protein
MGPLARPLTGDPPADDILRLFAVAGPAALPQSAVETALSTTGPYAPWDVAPLVAEAWETLLGSGALRPAHRHGHADWRRSAASACSPHPAPPPDE